MWFSLHVRKENLHQAKHVHITIRRAIALFYPHFFLVVTMVICILLTSILGVIPAYLTAQMIDRGIAEHHRSLLIGFAALAVLVTIVMGLIGVLQSYVSVLISQQVMTNLREDMYRHLLSLSLRFFGKTKLGDLISRFNNDIGGIQMIVTNTFTSSISSATTVIVTLLFMFAYNWSLTLIALAVIPLFVVPTQRVGKKNHALSRQTQEQWAELSTSLEETLDISGMLLIKNFSRQQHETERFSKTSQGLAQLSIHQATLGRWFYLFIGLVTTVGPIMIYVVGGLQAIDGSHISVGELVAFVVLLGRLYTPASQFANVWVSVQGASALLERIFAVFDEVPEIQDVPNAVALPPIEGYVTYDHVSFAYQDQPTLRDISFVAKPGQLIAVVGPSGAGKTTLTYLAARLYDVTTGTICIDGYDIRKVQLTSLASQIGMVTQETYLFHTSLRENIAYGCPDAPLEDIIAAAKAAAIHDMILHLPDGYETIIGERGHKLSGGEKQRIALARVILKNPRILILDEATSSLDSQSEALIQASLAPLMHERTTLVIAHRLSTILAADLILVLDGGRIVEQGTHQELLVQDGLYARLYREQFRGDSERLLIMQE